MACLSLEGNFCLFPPSGRSVVGCSHSRLEATARAGLFNNHASASFLVYRSSRQIYRPVALPTADCDRWSRVKSPDRAVAGSEFHSNTCATHFTRSRDPWGGGGGEQSEDLWYTADWDFWLKLATAKNPNQPYIKVSSHRLNHAHLHGSFFNYYSEPALNKTLGYSIYGRTVKTIYLPVGSIEECNMVIERSCRIGRCRRSIIV